METLGKSINRYLTIIRLLHVTERIPTSLPLDTDSAIFTYHHGNALIVSQRGAGNTVVTVFDIIWYSIGHSEPSTARQCYGNLNFETQAGHSELKVNT